MAANWMNMSADRGYGGGCAEGRGLLKGRIAQLTEALRKFKQVGVTHVGLQFIICHWLEHKEQIERFGQEALPALYN
jgi:hypothetical protein